MRYLLDTNICIHLMRDTPPTVSARFAELREGDIAISSITLAELEYGVLRHPDRRDERRARLGQLLELLPVVAFDRAASAQFGRLMAVQADRKGNLMNKLIAAHAISLDLTLVTNNLSDFIHLPALAVEDWVHP